MLAATVLATALVAAAQPMPQRPVPITIEGCRQYLQQAREGIQAIHRENLRCMSNSRPEIAQGDECSVVGRVVQRSTQAWPHCHTRERELCALYVKEDDGYQCVREAKQEAKTREKVELELERLNKAEKDLKSLSATWKDTKSAWNDPARFLQDKLSGKLNDKLLSELRSSRTELTGRGTTLMQETYDFLFNRTAGNKHLRSSNPVIAAIQGNAADELRRQHSYAIQQLEALTREMASISAVDMASSARGSTQGVPTRPTPMRPSHPSECSILDIPQAAQDLAIDDPTRFENLTRLCGTSK